MSRAYDSAVLADTPWLYCPLGPFGGADVSGNGRSVSATAGTITADQQCVSPGLNTSHQLSGTSPSVSFPSPPVADVASGGSFAVEVWITEVDEEVANGPTYWEARSAAQNRTQLGISPTGSWQLRSAPNSAAQLTVAAGTPSIVPVLGQPWHLVFGTENNVMFFFLNGQLIHLANWPTGNRATAQPNVHRLGRSADTFWGTTRGFYSNFAYYSGKLLAADRVREHYRIGLGEFAPRSRGRAR